MAQDSGAQATPRRGRKPGRKAFKSDMKIKLGEKVEVKLGEKIQVKKIKLKLGEKIEIKLDENIEIQPDEDDAVKTITKDKVKNIKDKGITKAKNKIGKSRVISLKLGVVGKKMQMGEFWICSLLGFHQGGIWSPWYCCLEGLVTVCMKLFWS